MKSFIVKTLVTGILLMIPVFFFLFALVKVFGTLRQVMSPIIEALDIETLMGVILLNVLTLLALVLFIFLIGLLAYVGSIRTRIEALDSFLRDRVPGYAIIKGILSGTIQQDTSMGDLKVVIVRQGDMARIGFEVERIDEHNIMVFLPDVPNPQTGIAAAFRPDDVQQIKLAPHKVLEMLSFFGRGVGAEISKVQQDRNPPTDT